MEETDLEKNENLTFEEDDSNLLPPNDIVAYNELRSCADLLRMYDKKVLTIKPEFQRDIVWEPAAQTRFIDSIIKQLPIPSMCFSYDYKSEKWEVVDGLQRIWTIIKFLTDDNWRLSRLADINPDLSGATIKNIKESTKLRKYFHRVENISLPITVLRCDYSKKSHKLYLFTIFHRLNTGGLKLNNQEIRNCIYSGGFNQLLKRLDKYENWRLLNKMEPGKSYRFMKQELILRFFAFFDKIDIYHGRLARFLNEYMSDRQEPLEDFINGKTELFERTVDLIFVHLFEENIDQKLGITLLEALLFGVAHNIDFLENKSHEDLEKYYNALLADDYFSDEYLRGGLSSKEKVINRLDSARNKFSDL